MNKKLFIALVTLGFAMGCHGQLPPTNSVVTLGGIVPPPPTGSTWLGCVSGQPACTFVFGRAVLPAGTSTCPQASGGAYTPLNAAVPAATLSYTDNTVSGLTVCYEGQTLQAGNVSQPSNTVGPFAVPASPLAPSVTGQTSTAGLVKPALSPDTHPALAQLNAPNLTARVTWR